MDLSLHFLLWKEKNLIKSFFEKKEIAIFVAK